MDRDKLLAYFEEHYLSRQEMAAMVPLGTRSDTLWIELLDRRKEKGRKLPLSTASGNQFWYVTTPKMIAASERIMEELFQDEKAPLDPYVEKLPVSTLEEAYYTGYVDGIQPDANEAMQFLSGGLNPATMEQQLLLNNRNAISFTVMNLYRKLDHNFLYMLYQIFLKPAV